MSTGDLGLDAALARWENEGMSAWFKEMCGETIRICPAAQGEWYIDKDGRTRCKLCDMAAT